MGFLSVMITDKEIKKKVKYLFHKNWKEFYPAKTLTRLGYTRHVCEKCGKGFWSIEPSNTCNDPECTNGYAFINKKVTKKKFKYKQIWDEYVKTFKKWGYKPIKNYPVVCRWYDALYFTAAGINDFQPYVISGEQAPPSQAVLEAQPCLRFPDINNVGITGRHYTSFIMVGQHVFNYDKPRFGFKKPFLYFKEEGIQQIHEYVTKTLGIKPEHVYYHEDVWAGGGNFGPSIEFFSHGMEIGNQVYMQYQVTPVKGFQYQELKTRVIDMGMGLEHVTWLSQATPTSYDVVFPRVMKYLYKTTGLRPDKELWTRFSKHAGLLNTDEVDDINKAWERVAKQIGYTTKELLEGIQPIKELYCLADHTRTLLFALTDGALPSNVGGGYNLRNLLRRCFFFNKKHSLDLIKLFELHAKEIGSWYTELKEYMNNKKSKQSLHEIIELEKKKYAKTQEKAKKLIQKIRGEVSFKELLTLYESHGVTPEMIKEARPEVEVPQDFYSKLSEEKEKTTKPSREHHVKLNTNLPRTKKLYYEDAYKKTFTAKVLSVQGKYVVLDKTLFYPEGGGQASDTGTINDEEVLRVFEQDNVIFHELKNKPCFKRGCVVKGVINWVRRYELMKLHSATHIINNACVEVLGPHAWQHGAKKTPGKAHLDVTHYQTLSPDQTRRIELLANKHVRQGIQTKIEVVPRAKAEKEHGFRIYQGGAVPSNELRLVKITDVEACAGLHVNNTREIKLIKIISAEKISDGVIRLTFVVDEKALKEVHEKEKALEELSALWGVNWKQVSATGKRFFEEWKKLSKKIKKLENEYVKSLVNLALTQQKEVTVINVPTSNLGVLIANLPKPETLKSNTVVLLGEKQGVGVGPKALKTLKERYKHVQDKKKHVIAYE